MSFDDPTSLWQRVAKPVVAITAVLAALTGIFALIWPSSAAFLAAVVVVVLLALSGAAWLASPTHGTSYRLGLSQRVRTSIAVAATLLTVTGAVWAWLQIVNRDLTQLAINDIRFSSTGDRMIVDVSLGAAEPVVVNRLILSEYWVEEEMACGGHSYEEISLGPVAQGAVVGENSVSITLGQINDRSGGEIQTSGEHTLVGGCSFRSSVTVHPQAGIDGGGHAGISISVPATLKVHRSVFYEPSSDPVENNERVGQDMRLFTDPNTKRDSTWDGYRVFFVAQASDDQGHCTRRVEEIFPEGIADTSAEAAEDLLEVYASSSSPEWWVEGCPD